MSLAIDEAWKYQLLTYPNPAVGAVIVKDGKPISIEAHRQAKEAHAELNALKAAYLKYNNQCALAVINNSFEIYDYLIKNSGSFFYDCTIYITLEPCNHIGNTPSCAKLLQLLGIKRVVIGISDFNKVASGGKKTLQDSNIDVVCDVMKKECEELLYPFIKWREGTFIFYKMAQTINGTVDGGYISSNEALAYVHSLRDKIDCLAIGGNTVRIDRPMLDSRYIKGSNPDIFIYSKSKDFSRDIPLFNVAFREVVISDDVFKLLDYNFVMVEGSYGLLNILKDKIDYIILLITPKIRGGLNAEDIELDFEIIHENYIGTDKIVYLRLK